MIGIKVVELVAYLLFIHHSLSIDLILPLSDEDAAKFQVDTNFLLESQGEEDYIYHLTKYEGLPNDLIRRVVYHGVELLNDKNDHPPDFRRYVLYALMTDSVVIGIGKKESGEVIYGPSFEITEQMVTNIMNSDETIESFLGRNRNSSLPILLSSIFNRNERSNKRKYDELDSVDDEAYLVRGNTDVSSKEIEKQVEDVIQNKSSTQTDPSLPGPSGITDHSNLRKKEKKDETSEDSDSD